jgi:transposase InsO family protein
MELTANLINMAYEQYWRARKRLAMPFNQHANWRKQAKLLNLSKDACKRLAWIIYYESKAKHNALATCRHFGIAPKVFYAWKNRFDGKNLRLLESKSCAPKNTRKRQITPEEELRVIKLRRARIRWGKIKLARRYQEIYGQKISTWKIQYTIIKWNLYYHPAKNARLKAKRKRSQSKKRITELQKQPFPGYLVSLDTIVIYWNGLKRYILTAIDDASKIAFARMYTTKSSRNAADFLRRMWYLMDGEIINGLSDNGSEFHKEFQEACVALGIAKYWSREHTPKDNPVSERFNRTLKEEFIDLGNFTPDPVLFNQSLTEWLIDYAFVRPHQSLGYDTPWQFYSKTAKVLPMYSSRTRSCRRVVYMLKYYGWPERQDN